MNPNDFTHLRTKLSGKLVLPGNSDWDRARASWNLAIDQQPAAVVEAAGTSDIQAAVRFARSAGLRVAPQGTGHGSESLTALDRALLLKTSSMNAVQIDASERVARVQAGALAGAVADAAATEGLAPVLGLATSVGVTGLALAGGIGWLSRTHGLACNNVEAFDVVLASGDSEHVDAESNPDLFWALRGGGGRAAIVTGAEFRGHLLPEISGGTLMWPAERLSEVLRRFRDLTLDAPDSLSLVFRYFSFPDVEGPPPHLRGRKLVAIVAAALGALPGELAALRDQNGVVVDTLAPIGPADLVRIAGDPAEPTPSRGGGFMLDELPDAALDQIVDALAQEHPLTVFELRHLGGAIGRSAPDHGAMAALPGIYSAFGGGAAVVPGSAEAILGFLAGVRTRLDPWATDRALISSAPSGTDPGTAFDPHTWNRLQAIERSYDPDRLILSNRDL